MADPRVDDNDELPDEGHVVRYCGFTKLRPGDGTPAPTAFLPDEKDDYLSVFWLEYANLRDEAAQWTDIRRRMVASNVDLKPKGKLAKLHVGRTRRDVLQHLSTKLAIKHMPVLNDGFPEPDPSHSGIHGIPPEPLDVAKFIADNLVVDLKPTKS